jgi:HK97 family phage portal protein
MSLIFKAQNMFRSIRASAYNLFVPMFLDGMPVYSDRKYRTYVTEGYRGNELVFACIEKTANTAAQCRLEVRKRGNDDPIEDHDLRKLLERPNPYMSEFDFFAYTLINYKLAGGAYWYKMRSKAGLVVELWPLRPDLIAPVPGKKELIEAWEYSPEGAAPFRMPADDVLAFRKVDPLNIFKTVSPMEVLGKSGDVDSEITNYLAKFFQKGANPAFVLKSKLKLSPQAITDILNAVAKRYGGTDNWHKPMVLDSDAEVQRTGLTFTEMEFSDLDARNESRICMVLDVPPIIVGTRFGLERSTDTNFKNSQKAWWDNSLIPLYKWISDVIDMQLAPDFGDDVDTAWNFNDVPALKESVNDLWARVNQAVEGGYITLNEARKELGFEDLGEPGDVFLRWLAQAAVPVDAAPPPPLQALQQAAVTTGGKKPDANARRNGGGMQNDKEPTNEQPDAIDGQPEGKAAKLDAEPRPYEAEEIASLWALYGQMEKVS